MSYYRVIPRDLFNESKLLKCMGKIALLVEDGMIPGLTIDEYPEDAGFQVEQGISGEIFIANLIFTDKQGEEVFFYTPLNSKEAWPLEMVYKDEIYYPLNSKTGDYQLSKDLFL